MSAVTPAPAPRARAPYGVYVHFPFCAHRCPYCDFAVTTEPPARGRRATCARVLAELELRAPALRRAPASEPLRRGRHAVALGSRRARRRWSRALRARLALPADAEVTVEANPESVDEPRLAAWRAAGVNRISIGVQSFDPAVLGSWGGATPSEAAARAVRLAAAALRQRQRRPHLRRPPLDGDDRARRRRPRRGARRGPRLGLRADARPGGARRGGPLRAARPRRQARLPRRGGDARAGPRRSAPRSGAPGCAATRSPTSRGRGASRVHNGLYWRCESYLGLGAGAVGCLRGARRRGPRGQPARLEGVARAPRRRAAPHRRGGPLRRSAPTPTSG